ncbi:hypothetical protein AJ80_01223 [Polytolypa hystricis UAMH7299]|uniref:Dihydroorotate dehydrogenase (quinone), mitochondrial n=1 Tax=Polytolypa hystricis (strain UAMH7299) TaxID=1447883 RepID=A0A2B7Z1N5_POLH7|nr:hypothetical protein AJ80_01223 [Polytolypa hystricis UAMH7299]
MALGSNGCVPRLLFRQRGSIPYAGTFRQPKARFVGRRYNSTGGASVESVAAASATKPPSRRLRKVLIGTSVVLVFGTGYLYATDTRASAHRWIIPPLVRWLYPDAEDAHHAGVDALKLSYRFGFHPRERGNPDGTGDLVTQVFGYTLTNPIGISGGLDKDADIPSPLFELGPAIVEVGGTTPLPQEGNPRPRVFRLPSQEALINRYGLNSKGADYMAAVLKQRVRDFAYSEGYGASETAERRVLDGEAGVPPGSLLEGKLLAVQVAKNKATPDNDIEAVKDDYVKCVDKLGKYADILVVNVSSPNTVGLRQFQQAEPLTIILKGVVDSAHRTDRKTKPKVMVKVSPDEDSDADISGICDAVWASGVDGVIVGNTTKKRLDPLPQGYALPAREQATLKETGGLSGPQLFDNTIFLVAKYRTHLDERLQPKAAETTPDEAGTPIEPADAGVTPALPSGEAKPAPTPKVIFASGGISTGKQAQQALDAGASVAMLYTGMIWGGAGTVTRIKEEMRDIRSGKQ